MLTQGLHVADVLGYLGSGVPLFGFLDSDREDIPEGYAWDMCNSDVLLNRASVKNGRIYLADGKSYAVLALPEYNNISIPVLRKIEEMVVQGIILVGNPPARSSGLTGFPDSDREVKAIVKKLWGETDGVNSFLNNYGKGKVYTGKTVAEVLALEKIQPDLAWEQREDVDLEYIHKTSGDIDIYYILNKWAWKGSNDLAHRNVRELPDRFIHTNCTFRVDGDRTIERWDPVTGEITPVNVCVQKSGSYTLPLSLEPEGAVFYVFKKADKTNNTTSIEKDGIRLTEGNTPLVTGASRVFVSNNSLEVIDNGEYKLAYSNGEETVVRHDDISSPIAIKGPWRVNFQENPLLGEQFTISFEKLISWTESEERRIKYYSGTAVYDKSFNVSNLDLKHGRVYLNLGKVGDIAVVKINGVEVGTLWKAPYIADITDYINNGQNKLEVAVTNLWINRLVGDQNLPSEERKTQTNLRNIKGRHSLDRLQGPDSDKYLRFSGLMGPVLIEQSAIYDLRK
jgi:hypothetical protein